MKSAPHPLATSRILRYAAIHNRVFSALSARPACLHVHVRVDLEIAVTPDLTTDEMRPIGASAAVDTKMRIRGWTSTNRRECR